jgi:hypothetical protein
VCTSLGPRRGTLNRLRCGLRLTHAITLANIAFEWARQAVEAGLATRAQNPQMRQHLVAWLHAISGPQ